MTNLNHAKLNLFNTIGLENMDHRLTLSVLLNSTDDIDDFFYNFYEGIGSNVHQAVQRYKNNRLGISRVVQDTCDNNNDAYYLLR